MPLIVYQEEDMPPAKGRHLNPPRIEVAEASPEDDFAPAPKHYRCQDRAGFRRKRHEFDKDGNCVFCGGRQRMVRV